MPSRGDPKPRIWKNLKIQKAVDFLSRFVLSKPFWAQVDQEAFQGRSEAKNLENLAIQKAVDFIFRFVLSKPFRAQVDQEALQGGSEAKNLDKSGDPESSRFPV